MTYISNADLKFNVKKYIFNSNNELIQGTLSSNICDHFSLLYKTTECKCLSVG